METGTLQQRGYWTRPDSKTRLFKLFVNDDTVAELDMTGKSLNQVSLRLNGQQWTFTKIGCFNCKIVLKEDKSGREFATFIPDAWGNGRLQLADGSVFKWKPVSVWRTTRVIVNQHNLKVLEFDKPDRKNQPERADTRLIVKHADDSLNGIKCLLMSALGMYLFALQDDEMDVDSVSLLAAIM